MRSNRNFWFWVFAVAPIFVLLAFSTVYELNIGIDKGLSIALSLISLTVLVVSLIGMLRIFQLDRRHARAIRNLNDTGPSVSVEVPDHTEKANRRDLYSLYGIGLFGLIQLSNLLGLTGPQKLWVGWIVLGVWAVLLWFMLVKEGAPRHLESTD